MSCFSSGTAYFKIELPPPTFISLAEFFVKLTTCFVGPIQWIIAKNLKMCISLLFVFDHNIET